MATASSPAAILRVNERLKLAATAFNNIALAFAIAGFVGPVVSGGEALGGAKFLWLFWGVGFHMLGQLALGRLRA